jgi:hypothetical protein
LSAVSPSRCSSPRAPVISSVLPSSYAEQDEIGDGVVHRAALRARGEFRTVINGRSSRGKFTR